MMKKVTSMFLGTLMLIGISASVFGWGSATHAFISDQLKRRGGPQNLNEIYGSLAPDIFNYAFDLQGSLYTFLHWETHDNFMQLWDSVKFGYEKSFAYGYVSHNDAWGADSTAHHASLTLIPGQGYVITKAIMLDSILMNDPSYAGLELPADIRVDMCHNVVEAAGDILIKRMDPLIGKKIVEAASRPSQVFRNLLFRAYAQDLASFVGSELAVQIISGYEFGFRNAMVAYGTALQQTEAVSIELIVADFNNLVMAYLISKGVDPGSLPSDLSPLIQAAMSAAITICEADYIAEIWATLDRVDRELKDHLTTK